MDNHAMTFEEFVEYGIAVGGNVVKGMPWSFEFHGCAVTHENDDLYLISRPGGKETLQFKRGDMIAVGPRGANVQVYSSDLTHLKSI